MKVKACVFVLAVLCASPSFATPIVSLQPSTSALATGGSFTIDVTISNIEDLFGFQLDFGFDPALTAVTGLAPGHLLTQFGLDVDADGNFTNFIFTNLGDTVPGPGLIGSIFGAPLAPVTVPDGEVDVLATLTIKAINPGDAKFSLSIPILDSGAGDLPPDVPDATVAITAPTDDVTPVPEPATLFLFGTGLVTTIRKFRGGRTK